MIHSTQPERPAWSLPEALGSLKTLRSRTAERRRSARHPYPLDNPVLVKAADGEPIEGQVRDVSLGGIGLVLRRRYEPGTLLNVEITNRSGLFSCTLVVRVVHISKGGDGTFLVGGAFVLTLRCEDLRALLA
jgi:hypothetical protein